MADPTKSKKSPMSGAKAHTKTRSKPKPKPRKSHKVRKLPPYNVVLLNDDDHTYDYVISMLTELFAHPTEKAYQLAKIVDSDGRAIVMTTHREHAELKRDQILAYGTDVRVATCKGSMSAAVEPAN